MPPTQLGSMALHGLSSATRGMFAAGSINWKLSFAQARAASRSSSSTCMRASMAARRASSTWASVAEPPRVAGERPARRGRPRAAAGPSATTARAAAGCAIPRSWRAVPLGAAAARPQTASRPAAAAPGSRRRRDPDARAGTSGKRNVDADRDHVRVRRPALLVRDLHAPVRRACCARRVSIRLGQQVVLVQDGQLRMRRQSLRCPPGRSRTDDMSGIGPGVRVARPCPASVRASAALMRACCSRSGDLVLALDEPPPGRRASRPRCCVPTQSRTSSVVACNRRSARHRRHSSAVRCAK